MASSNVVSCLYVENKIPAIGFVYISKFGLLSPLLVGSYPETVRLYSGVCHGGNTCGNCSSKLLNRS